MHSMIIKKLMCLKVTIRQSFYHHHSELLVKRFSTGTELGRVRQKSSQNHLFHDLILHLENHRH